MSRPQRRALLHTRAAFVLAGSLMLAPSVARTPVTPAPGPQGSGSAPTPDVARSPWADAATALRHRDCDAAIRDLEPLAEDPAEARFVHVVQGLYAHACEDVDRAETLLAQAGQPDGRLEDWRLLVFADAAAARGHLPAARAALSRLLADYPTSPLRRQALLRAARLGWQERDAAGALSLIAWGRGWAGKGDAARSLDVLAWEIATSVGDRQARLAAARRLLVDAPAEAVRLDLRSALDAQGDLGSWTELLDADGLRARARSLLDRGMADEAVETLEAVAERARDLPWALLEAEALTRSRRGAEALALLRDRTSEQPADQASLEWARALAAAEAATVRRGRVNPPAAERERLRRESRTHLQHVVELGADRRLAVAALRRLFADLSEDDASFDAAMGLLRRLRILDPSDTTGTDFLWERGWESFRRRNFSTAVGYWAELCILYPDSPEARGGRYWSGRAYEKLGNVRRARELYAEVAGTDTTDFYRRYALARLRGVRPRAAKADRAEAWPQDLALRRAALLSDLGLDDLALAEIDARRTGIPPVLPRAAAALESRILARKGERRESVRRIRDAFPDLGGPDQGAVPEEARRLYYPRAFEAEIRASAARAHLPPDLVFAMVRQESAFDAQARSRAGATGLMQLMPTTGRELARHLGLPFSPDRLSDPAYNVHLGTSYFHQVLRMFDGRLELALAGYNGGPYRIRRLWRQAGAPREVDAFVEGLTLGESRSYVKRILLLSDSYRRLYEGTGDTGAR